MLKKIISSFFVLLLICFVPFSLGMAKKEELHYCDTISPLNNGGQNVSEWITIEYDSYTVSEMYMNRITPRYEGSYLSNSCAPVAGISILGYHDVTKDNLIPNFTAGYTYEGEFYYSAQDQVVDDTLEELYDLMGTNTTGAGTTETQFINGLTSYVNGQGYNIAFNSCGSTFNKDTAISYLNNQIPIVMFLNTYVYYVDVCITMGDTSAEMHRLTSPNGHVVSVFGYREYNFYSGGSIFRTDRYMLVSFGDTTTGLISINNLNTIVGAYAVNIT